MKRLVAVAVLAVVACRTVSTSNSRSLAPSVPRGTAGWMLEQQCRRRANLDAGRASSEPAELFGCRLRCVGEKLEILEVLDGGKCLEPFPPDVVLGMELAERCEDHPEQLFEWDDGACHMKCVGNIRLYSDRPDAGEPCMPGMINLGVNPVGDFPPFGPPWDDGVRAPQPSGR